MEQTKHLTAREFLCLTKTEAMRTSFTARELIDSSSSPADIYPLLKTICAKRGDFMSAAVFRDLQRASCCNNLSYAASLMSKDKLTKKERWLVQHDRRIAIALKIIEYMSQQLKK